MGKVANIARAKKRRDKKYDPYKTNPLNKQLTNAVNGSDLDSAVEKNEDGSIKIDEAGKPVFKDVIEWESDSGQIMAIWTSIKTCLEEKVVPPNEIDACHDLMLVYANLHRNSSKPFMVSMPINYFVGTWHILNSCRMFHFFEKDKGMDSAIDGLTMWFAERIDMYHEVKRREKVEDDIVSPTNSDSSVPNGKTIEFKKDYYAKE